MLTETKASRDAREYLGRVADIYWKARAEGDETNAQRAWDELGKDHNAPIANVVPAELRSVAGWNWCGEDADGPASIVVRGWTPLEPGAWLDLVRRVTGGRCAYATVWPASDGESWTLVSYDGRVVVTYCEGDVSVFYGEPGRLVRWFLPETVTLDMAGAWGPGNERITGPVQRVFHDREHGLCVQVGDRFAPIANTTT